MLKLKWLNSKKTGCDLPVAEKQTSKVKPPDKYSAVLKTLLVISVMVQSQIASAFDSGPVASVQDEAIVACYARYAKIAYLPDKRLKSLPDCDRRFSPNEKVPFRFIKTLAVADTMDFLEKGNNLDFYFRERTDDEHTKRQLLIAFRGTGSAIDLWTDARTQTRLSKAIYDPESNVAEDLELSGVFGNKSGGPYEGAAFPGGFYDRGKKHHLQIRDFLRLSEFWRDDKPEKRSLEVIITGHSLGASSSQVMGLWLMDRFEKKRRAGGPETKVEVFGFNSPKTANLTTQMMVKKLLDENAGRYRIHLFLNAVDAVSRIPGITNKRYYHTVDHEDSVIASGTALEYKAVAWGKAAVNSVDLQEGFDGMEVLYENGCYSGFPNWPNIAAGEPWWNPIAYIPCARSAALLAHSLEQWFTTGWTDYSVPTIRRHLFPDLEGNEIASNEIDLVAQTNVSMFNDHQSALDKKRLVKGRKYRFQRSNQLAKCLVTEIDTKTVDARKCSIRGPRDFLFKAVHSSKDGTVLLRSESLQIPENKCLSSETDALEICAPSNQSQQFQIVYDERSDLHRTPGAYSLKSQTNKCITDFWLNDCPVSGQSGQWIVTEAPWFNRYEIPEKFQMMTEYNKDLNCIYAKSNGILKLNEEPGIINNKPSCHDEHLRRTKGKYEREIFYTHRTNAGNYLIYSNEFNQPIAPMSYENKQHYVFGGGLSDRILTGHYLAKWFDGTYLFQGIREAVDGYLMSLWLPHTGLLDKLDNLKSPHLGYIGSRSNKPHDNAHSYFAKLNSIHLRPVIEYDRHHPPECTELSGTPHVGYDLSGNCSITKRVDAKDDPYAARIRLQEIVDIDVLKNDSHVHAGPLDITDVSASRGTASINEDGTIRFQAPSDYSGTVSISYSITDGLPEMADMPHGSDTAVATVDVVENVALNKPASQITTEYGGIASRAVDGNTNGNWSNGSVTHTTSLHNAFWTVDLKGSHEVKEIKLFNRLDCCQDRLTNFKVILDRVGGSAVVINSSVVENQDVFTFPTNVSNVVRVTVQLNGKNHLSLAEVQVFGWETKSASVKLQNQQSVLHKGTRGSQGNYELACPAGYAITGYTGYGEHLMSSAKFRCHKIGTDGKWGPEAWTKEWGGNNAGGGDTTRYSEMCSQDKYVTNIITKSSKAWVIDTEFECGRISLDIENKNRSYRYNPENKHVDMTGSPNGRYTDNTSGSACTNNNVNQNGKYARVFTKANVGRKRRSNAKAYVVNEIKYYCDQVKLQ